MGLNSPAWPVACFKLYIDHQKGEKQAMSRFIILFSMCYALLFANGALAESQEDRLRSNLTEIQAAIMQQNLVNRLRIVNENRRNMTQADIDGLDAIWHAELGSGNRPLVTGVVRNITALRMRKVIRDTGRVVSAINVIDARGVSIAQTTIFPHIWQGTAA